MSCVVSLPNHTSSWAGPSHIIQLTLVISKFKGQSETIQDICTSTYRICRIEEKIN